MKSKKPICRLCGAPYNEGRRKLGFTVCMDCGEKMAQREMERKRKRTAPLYNKGGYQYITDGDSLKSLNRKV